MPSLSGDGSQEEQRLEDLLARSRDELAAEALRQRAASAELARAEATLGVVLHQLWRRRVPVQLATTAGLVLDAPLTYVGEDFCVQRASSPERRRVVPLAGVAWMASPLRAEPDARAPGPGARLADYLELAAQEHPFVTVAATGASGQSARGRLSWASQHLLVLGEADGEGGTTRYVPLSALAELTLLASGS